MTEDSSRRPLDAMVSGNVVRVNNGNVFGNGDWWTFFCPNCSAQIERDFTEDDPCVCGCIVIWPTVPKCLNNIAY